MHDDILSAEPGSQIQSFIRIYKLPLLLGLGSILLIVVASVALVKSATQSDPIQFSQSLEASGSANVSAIKIKADVEGAVVHPGLYELDKGSRIDDLLRAAGGVKGDADTGFIEQKINRAAILSDGAKLYIPQTGEMNTSYNYDSSSGVTPTSYNSGPLLQRSGGSSQNGLVSINSDSQTRLESLPGVGPVTATKIISGRPYLTLQELVVKKAVGNSTFEKIKDLISL